MTQATDTVSIVLGHKGSTVHAVPPNISVYEALEVMADKKIGALLVMEAGRLLGILSERDYARKIILQGRSSRETRVDDVMTTPAVTVTREYTVEDCMRVMTEHRVRHLPVMIGDDVFGVVSLGDLVAWTIRAHEETIEHLKAYIAGGYPV